MKQPEIELTLFRLITLEISVGIYCCKAVRLEVATEAQKRTKPCPSTGHRRTFCSPTRKAHPQPQEKNSVCQCGISSRATRKDRDAYYEATGNQTRSRDGSGFVSFSSFAAPLHKPGHQTNRRIHGLQMCTKEISDPRFLEPLFILAT